MKQKKETTGINKPQSWYLGKINKIDTPARLIRKQTEKTPIANIRNQREDITLNIKKIRECYGLCQFVPINLIT